MNGNNKDISPPTPEELQEVGVDSPKKDNGIPPPTSQELQQLGVSGSPQIDPPTPEELRSVGIQTDQAQGTPFHSRATSTERPGQDDEELGIFEVLGNAWQRGWNIGEQANILNVGSDPDENALQQISDIQKENQSLKPSQAYKEFNQSKTFGEALGKLAEDPLTIIPEITLESLSALVKHGMGRVPTSAATGAGIGSVLPGGGTATGAGLGAITGLGLTSLNLEYSGSILESFQEAGADLQDPESLQEFFSDEEKLKSARSTALKKGIPIGLFDMVSAGVAGRIGAEPAKSVLRKFGREVGELGVQSSLGGAGEFSGQIVSGQDISPPAILAEMVGETGVSVPEIAIGHIVHKKNTGQTVTPDDYKNIDDVDKAAQEIDKAQEIGQITEVEAAQMKQELQSSVATETEQAIETPEPQESEASSTEQTPAPEETTPQPETETTRVYRETSIEQAEAFLPTSNTDTGFVPGVSQTFVADNPDLALGQGDNQGVVLEFESDLSAARVNTEKPGLEVAEGNEFILDKGPEDLRSDLRRVTVKSGAKTLLPSKAARFKRFANQLTEQGWSRRTLDNGDVVYEHPFVEGTDVATPIVEEPTTPEPIPSFDQPAPVLEGDYQIEFTEGDTVIREDYQVDTQRTPVVTNTRTDQPVGRSSRNYVPALAEYFTRLDDSGKRVDAPLLEEGVTLDEGEYVSRVAQESESPTEILEAIEVHQQTDPNSPAILDDAISNVLWQEGHTITRNDLEQFADPALIEGDQGRFYRLQLQKEGTENTDLANLTQMVNDRLNTDYSTSDIMDHWLDYHDARRNQTDPTLDKLKQRFEQVTGEPYSPRLAREVSLRQDARAENTSMQEAQLADDIVSKVGDNVFDEQGEIVQSEFASEIEQLQQTDPQLAEYLTRQPDEQARQQQTQQESQQPGLQDRAQQEPVQQTPEGDQGVTQPPSDYGQSNRIINREEYEQLRQDYLNRIGGQLSAGIDPQTLKLAAKVALFHVEAGARKFSDFAAAMINDIGDQVKPYLANLYRTAAEKAEVPNSQFSTDEEISAWEQQNLTAEQRQQSPQDPIDLSDVQTPEQPVTAGWTPPTPRQLEEAITTANKDKSDYIKRRLKDPQDNPEFTEGLEEIGDYQVQSTVQANLEADRLVDDFMDNLGDKSGLRELFNLLKKGMIPPLMAGPLSAKITMKMQALGMNDEALAVNDWKQKQARESARFMRSLRSDASPEETVTRVFADLTKAKQKAMSEEGPKGDGRSWQDIMSEVFQQLRELKKQADQNPEIDFQSRAIDLVEEALRPVGTETRTEQNQRKAAAQGIVEGFTDGQTIESLSDQLAGMANFEVLDQDLKDRLLEQAEKVTQLSNEGKRELAYNAWEDLMNELQQEGLSSRPLQEIFTDLWYTAVLSGLTTQARSQKGSTLTSSIFTVFRLLGNPVAAPLMISQIAKGFKGGLGTYMHILKTGRSDIRFGDYKMTAPRLTIQLLNTKMKDLGVSQKALKMFFALPTYMYNSIKGWDANLKTAGGEANAALMEYERAKESSDSRLEALRKARKALGVDQEQRAAEQAAYEVEQMKENGEKIPQGYQKRRAREIVIEMRDQKMMDRAWKDAGRAALVSDPIGLLGEIYKQLNRGMMEGSQGKQWTSLITRLIMAPFIRVFFNYTRFGLSFTPAGFVMGQADTVWTADGVRPVNEFERNEYFARAAAGTAIFTSFFLSMFDNDEDEGWKLRPEEDRWLDITGNLTGNWWEEKDTKPGTKPWAIRVRNPVTGEWSGYYKYIDNPIGFGLAPIGIMRDEFVHKEFQEDVADREEIRNKKHRGASYLFTTGIYGMFRYAMDQSFNQGLNNIHRLTSEQDAEEFEEQVYNTFGRPLQGLYPNMYNQMYTQYRALMDIPEKEANGFWENMGKKVPILDDLIKQKQVDVFGYPVVRDLDTPMIPDWLLKQAKDNLNYREEIPEWQLVHKYEEVVIGSFYAPETFKGKKVPDPVREKFVERAGELMRTQVQGNYRALNSMEAVDLQRELNRMKGFAYRQARLELVERPFRFGEWDDINEE